MSTGEIVDALRFHSCCEGVTRQGILVPCEKTAVALRIDPEDSKPYAVCAFHSRGEMIPLHDLVRAATWNLR